MFKFTVLSIGIFVLLLANAAFAANFTVTKTADTNDGVCDADCSFREAVGAANTTAGNDAVYFALPLFSLPQTIVLSGSEIVIANNGSITINGTGANRLTISGNNASRILSVNENTEGTIRGVRLTAGNGAGAANTGRGGAFYNNGGMITLIGVVIAGNTAANGGGSNHASAATTRYIDCVVSNNTASSSGGGMQNFSTSSLFLINTTVNNNVSTSSTTGGGGIQANGFLNIVNSTFSGNSVGTGSGGAFYYNGTGLTMTNTTIANNTSPTGAGGFHKATTTNNANIRNSIFAGNSTADVSNVINSLGNNIIGAVGTSTGWVGSDLQNTNPLLTPLGFHGGLGMTHVPTSLSPAVNAGQNCVVDLSCSSNPPITNVNVDQRGASRPANGTVDIGSVETSADYYASPPSAVAGVPYNFVLAPAASGFTYLLSSGTFGGITLTSSTSAFLSGTANQPGSYIGGVQITNGPNTAVVNYQINVLPDPMMVFAAGVLRSVYGSPIRNAVVIFTDRNGISRTGVSNSFGYFRIEPLTAGETYAVSISSKQYAFITPAEDVLMSDALIDLELIASPLK